MKDGWGVRFETTRGQVLAAPPLAVIARVVVYDELTWRPARLRRGISFGELVVGVLFVVVALRALLMPTQADTFWHLRDGRRHLAQPAASRASTRIRSPPFGWPWRDHEWLWQPLSYACYRLGGMPLLALFGGADRRRDAGG